MTLTTFYLPLYDVEHMVKDYKYNERKYFICTILETTHTTTFVTPGRKEEMFYLTTHSTHFNYGYMASDMVKDHSDSETGNPLPPHGLLFPINSKGSFKCTIPDRIAHTTAFVTPVVEHGWNEK